MARKQPDTFAARLRSLREAGGLSVDELSRLSGVHRMAIYRLEKGERQPSLATAKKLADALGHKLRVFED